MRRAWGIVDVDDCINAAKHLARQRSVDRKRSVMSGVSAGGYTTLAALTFRKYFAGGASYYGVSDISALATSTHKFEEHYFDWLIGPYPQDENVYRARSPIFHVERLLKPVIFFQGDKDPIVPLDQTEKIVDALRQRKIPVVYLLFAGEGHGFKKASSIKRALDAELNFYSAQVFRTRFDVWLPRATRCRPKQMPLSRVRRTWAGHAGMSPVDPKRTSRRDALS